MSTSSPSLAPGRSVKVGRLVCNPAQEPGHLLVRQQWLARAAKPHELRIGEAGMDHTVANRMDRNGRLSALRLGHHMVLLNPSPEGALTQPAGGERVKELFVGGHRNLNQAPSQGYSKPVSR